MVQPGVERRVVERLLELIPVRQQLARQRFDLVGVDHVGQRRRVDQGDVDLPVPAGRKPQQQVIPAAQRSHRHDDVGGPVELLDRRRRDLAPLGRDHQFEFERLVSGSDEGR